MFISYIPVRCVIYICLLLRFADHTKTFDQFDYSDSDINDIIYACICNTTFTGVSKDYMFSEDGDLEDDVIVERIQSTMFFFFLYILQFLTFIKYAFPIHNMFYCLLNLSRIFFK